MTSPETETPGATPQFSEAPFSLVEQLELRRLARKYIRAQRKAGERIATPHGMATDEQIRETFARAPANFATGTTWDSEYAFLSDTKVTFSGPKHAFEMTVHAGCLPLNDYVQAQVKNEVGKTVLQNLISLGTRDLGECELWAELRGVAAELGNGFEKYSRQLDQNIKSMREKAVAKNTAAVAIGEVAV